MLGFAPCWAKTVVSDRMPNFELNTSNTAYRPKIVEMASSVYKNNNELTLLGVNKLEGRGVNLSVGFFVFLVKMGLNDRCVVGTCKNAKKYPENYVY